MPICTHKKTQLHTTSTRASKNEKKNEKEMQPRRKTPPSQPIPSDHALSNKCSKNPSANRRIPSDFYAVLNMVWLHGFAIYPMLIHPLYLAHSRRGSDCEYVCVLFVDEVSLTPVYFRLDALVCGGGETGVQQRQHFDTQVMASIRFRRIGDD